MKTYGLYQYSGILELLGSLTQSMIYSMDHPDIKSNIVIFDLIQFKVSAIVQEFLTFEGKHLTSLFK